MSHRVKILNLVQLLTDIVVIALSWFAAYAVRFFFIDETTGPIYHVLSFTPLIVLTTIFTYAKKGLYHIQRYHSWYKELLTVVASNTIGLLAFVVAYYFLEPARLSRLTLLIYFFIVNISTIIIRIIFHNILEEMRQAGKNLKNILLVGQGELVNKYIHNVFSAPFTGINIIGWVEGDEQIAKEKNIQVIREESVEEFLKEALPETVVIGKEGETAQKYQETIRFYSNTSVNVLLLLDIQYSFIGYSVQEFNGIPLIDFNTPNISQTGTVLKRTIDIIGSILLIILFSPLFTIITLLVKATSKGPLFYGQKRVSLNGDLFTMWKFRSMAVNAENKTGAVWAQKGDDRTTAVGRFLRKTSLDEIPQFWNVLKGDMSLVGPRPERPQFVNQFKQEIPAYMIRHKVRGGITGWAQVNGWRGNTSLEKRIEFDIYYLKNWSIFLDIKILFLTLLKGFIHENAY